MKRNFRTTIVLILALLLAFGSICFVSAEPEEKPFTHLVLGDSANLGFALKSYLARDGEGSFCGDDFYGFNCLTKGSYPELMDTYLKTLYPGVKTYQYGAAGARCYDIRHFLDDSYPSDFYHWWFFEAYTYDFMLGATEKAGETLSTEEALDCFRGMYRSAAREADLITLDLGMNDITSWINTMLLTGMDPELGRYLSGLRYDKKTLTAVSELRTKLAAFLPQTRSGILPEEYRQMLDVFMAAYLDATVGMDQLIECIRDLNPDAKLIVASLDNPMSGYDLRSGDSVLPIDDILELITEAVNTYRRTLSPYAGKYYFADFSGDSVHRILDEMKEPESFTEDAEYLMRYLLEGIGVNSEALEAAEERVREILRTVFTVTTDGIEDVDGFPIINDDAIVYLNTGYVPDEATMAVVKEYIASMFVAYGGYCVHPSSQGYLDKFPAYVNAFHADDTPRAYNAVSAVSHMHRVEDAVKETVKESVKTVVKAVSETIRNNIRMAIGIINGKKTSR